MIRLFRLTGFTGRIPAIGRLFLPGSPAAIFSIVMTVVIETVDGCAFEPPGFHIAEKGVERVRPLGTHRYSAPAVGREIGMLWVKTATLYVFPTGFKNPSKIRRGTHSLLKNGGRVSMAKKA